MSALSVAESWPRHRDRIRAVITRCGLSWPDGEVDVVSSPATVDASEASDLAIAVAVLSASGQVPTRAARDVICYAGLNDDGGLLPGDWRGWRRSRRSGDPWRAALVVAVSDSAAGQALGALGGARRRGPADRDHRRADPVPADRPQGAGCGDRLPELAAGV